MSAERAAAADAATVAAAAAPRFGLVVVGDEILSGKRADKHLPHVIGLLAERGLRLSWAEYVGDEPARITAVLRRAFAGGDVVFCTGGIGATPDDHTRQCAAEALGVPLVLHPEARRLILERAADTARAKGPPFEPDRPDNVHRLNMGRLPQGARLVPNPYNKIPGFFCASPAAAGAGAVGDAPGHAGAGAAPAAATRPAGVAGIYFVPGFPVMAWPMLAWALDTDWAACFHRDAWQERSVIVYGAMESALAPLMERIEHGHPGVKVFSLPSVDHPEHGAHIELGVKGAADVVAAAFAALRAGLAERSLRLVPELVRP